MDERDEVSKTHLCIALLQFLTAIFLIGWIWAIYWSVLIVMEARHGDDGQQVKANNRGYAGVSSGVDSNQYGGPPGQYGGMGGGFQQNPNFQ